MKNLISLGLLLFSAGVLLQGAPAQEAAAADPIKVVACDSSASDSATYITVGTKCTSSSHYTRRDKQDQAVADANRDFAAGINKTHQCKGCPDGQTGCTSAGVTTTPNPPYAWADCVFTYEGGCQGNPLKTLIIATCTSTVAWSYACSECTEDDAGNGSGGL